MLTSLKMLSNLKIYAKETVFDLLGEIPKRIPDFFVLGASRSGTTYLHHALKQHPDIFMPRSKELHYFDKDFRYKENLLGYRSLFRGYKDQKLIGEITPFYFYAGMIYDQNGKVMHDKKLSPVSRIYKHCPNAKIIITLRDPLTRLISMYKKNFGIGKFDLTLEQALKAELDEGSNFPNYLYRNRYDIHLKNIYEYYPKAQVKLIIFENWNAELKPTLNEICSFLDLREYDEAPVMQDKNQNEGSKYNKDDGRIADITLEGDIRARALEYLKPAYDYVEDQIGKPVPWIID